MDFEKFTEEEIRMGVYDQTKGHPKKVSQLYAAAKQDFQNVNIEEDFMIG